MPDLRRPQIPIILDTAFIKPRIASYARDLRGFTPQLPKLLFYTLLIGLRLQRTSTKTAAFYFLNSLSLYSLCRKMDLVENGTFAEFEIQSPDLRIPLFEYECKTIKSHRYIRMYICTHCKRKLKCL